MINKGNLSDAIRVEMNDVLTDHYFTNPQKDAALHSLGCMAKRLGLNDVAEDINDLRLNMEGVA